MPKNYKVRITANAQNDLEHIFFYIAVDSINNAKNFILELEKKIYSLDTLPERFALIPENVFSEQTTGILFIKSIVQFTKLTMIPYTYSE